jgi:hypothetical protein
MLNGMERTLEKQLPANERRWLSDKPEEYGATDEGYPSCSHSDPEP